MEALYKYIQYFPIFFLSFAASFLLTPIVGYIAKKVGAVDKPAGVGMDERGAKTRMHTKEMPRLGGLAVFIPIFVLTLVFLPLDKQLVGVLIGLLILAVAGYIDDKENLPSSTQFIAQILAALAIVFTGTGISVLRIPFIGEVSLELFEIPLKIQGIEYHLSLPSDLITIGWIFLVINSINWVAGIDGLVEGITGISGIIITLLSIRFFTHPTAVMGISLAGGVLGFLPYNFNPAKIISGSIGDYIYGFLLAVLSIYSGAKFATAIMLLGLPILDALWVIVYRIRKYQPNSLKELLQAVTESDKVHLHHRLLEMGLTVRQVDYVEYAIVAVLGIIAFMLTGLIKTLAVFVALILGIVFILFTSKKFQIKKTISSTIKRPEGDSPEKKFAY